MEPFVAKTARTAFTLEAVRFPWRERATPRQPIDVGIAPLGASEQRRRCLGAALCQGRIVDVALLLAGIECCLIRGVERGLAPIAEWKIRIGQKWHAECDQVRVAVRYGCLS